MSTRTLPRPVIELYRKATACRECFKDCDVQAPTIDIAQPRWIGSGYFNAHPRVVVVMLNPGSGDGRKDEEDNKALHLLRNFKRAKGTLDAVLTHQGEDMEIWGKGKFVPFYTDALGLSLDDIAFANIAWCGTRGNKYPGKMLKRCFARHTSKLLELLQPDIVVLSGTGAQRFRCEIENLATTPKTISILHFAHRKGRDAESSDLRRAKSRIASLRGSKRQ